MVVFWLIPAVILEDPVAVHVGICMRIPEGIHDGVVDTPVLADAKSGTMVESKFHWLDLSVVES